MQPGNHINEYSTCFIKNILMYVCRLRPPIVDFLFPVTHPHCNFRAACNVIIAFADHVIKILLCHHVVKCLCGFIVGAATGVMVHYRDTTV